ncbi:hypothetical protein Tco_0828475 [Tanacetum coccineum]
MSSDSTLSAVTYTSVYSDSEPWRFQWVSDAEPQSLEAAPQAPPSPDYVPGPEHPPSPDYVPGPEYPEYLALLDDDILIEYQSLPADASPTALSPGYIADSDPKEDPEDDPEEDLADYPADGGDEEEESSGDDADDEDEEEASEEEDDDEEEEHLARPTLLLARISVRISPPMAASIEACITEYAGAPTPPSPPPSLLTLLSSPLPQIPSPPLPLPSPPTHTSPTYAEAPLGYRAVGIRLRAASPLPLPAPSSPLPLPAIGRREDVPEADVPPQKSIRAVEERAMAAVRVVNLRVSYQADVRIRESEEFYTRHQDAQDDRAAVRAEIEVLRRERLAYEKESSETRQALARSEAHNRALEARIATIETQLYR